MHLPSALEPRAYAFLALVALVACGPPVPAVPPSGASTGGEETSGGHGSTAAQDESDASRDPSAGEPPSEDPDGGSMAYECDIWTQNCPAGQKCAYWANDGGTTLNATRCVDVVPDADQSGELCTVDGNGMSGVDTCVLGAMCWNVDYGTNEGTCVEMCMGSIYEPMCSDPTMLLAVRGPCLCLPTCCPLEQDCTEGQACYPANDAFSCLPDASGDMGGLGDTCEFINVCEPGLVCVKASLLADCAGGLGCCTAYCEVGSMSCSLLHPDFECTPWYTNGQAPLGLEHIGACTAMG